MDVVDLPKARPADEGRTAYVFAEALLRARELHGFSRAGETTHILLGEFSLTLDERVISGRDAVMWFKERRLGRQVFRDIELYVEGEAKVVEADGTTTKDRSMFIIVHQAGRLRARVGRHSGRELTSLPLYKRAIAMRKRLSSAPRPRRLPAVLVVPRPTSRPTATAPAGEDRRRPLAYEPVSFRADHVSVRKVPDPAQADRQRRVTILKGGVYLSQGSPDSGLFLSLSSDFAVVFSRDDPEARGQIKQRIVGAYLEGDVILRRGERSVEGERLFYDFEMGRALILQPVLRTVQEQRNIPVYIRAKEGRQLGARREKDTKGRARPLRGDRWTFRDAIVTTSDFRTPTYHIGARRVYLEDATLYDERGVAVSERRWKTRLTHTTFNVRSVPVTWWPFLHGDAREGHTALRKAQFGQHGRYGWGAETEWFLFRLLGLPRPEGVKGRFSLDWYERGVLGGAAVSYDRQTYFGYARATGMIDGEQEDDFGTDRRNLDAQRRRGRVLWRHKQHFPRDWLVQAEFSYLCDRNFLEEFYPGEFWNDKPQESLLYARKQRDNWAVTVLVKGRVNDFLTQTESLPEVAGYLVGQPLWGGLATLYSEGRVGLVRYRPGERDPILASRTVARLDTRQEIDALVRLGALKVVPYVVGRLTYWEDTPGDQGLIRPWGQVGVRAAMDVWRLYNDVDSRLWDLHRIKHVITPYGGVFAACTEVEPDRLKPFTPGIEEHVRRLGGGTFGIRQLWQTKRGPADDRHTVDWLRLDVSASFFTDADTSLPGDGRFFQFRPEYSLPRNAVNGEFAWHISDSTTLLGDANYDTDTGRLARFNAGLAVSRRPRLKYYLGLRRIEPLDSSVGTVGLYYQLNPKYQLNVFEQYDFSIAGGQNESTSLTLVRKFPRWYVGLTFIYDRTQDDVGLILALWPEGIPELRVGGPRMSLMESNRRQRQ